MVVLQPEDFDLERVDCAFLLEFDRVDCAFLLELERLVFAAKLNQPRIEEHLAHDRKSFNALHRASGARKMGRIHITVKFSLLLLNLQKNVRVVKLKFFEFNQYKKIRSLKLLVVTLSNTKNVKSAFVAEFDIGSNMSELQLRLAGNETVRATITSDGQQVFSVYGFINLACDKRGRFANKVWERLISEDSVHKDELDELFTLEYVNGLIGQR